MPPFALLLAALHERAVRFVLIGVEGANCWAPDGSSRVVTHDRDLFLPLDAPNLLRAWQACGAAGYELVAGSEPLDFPRDAWLAERVVARRALTRAHHADDLLPVDLTLVMAGFEFEQVWREHREFRVGETT